MELIGKHTPTSPCVATIGTFDGVHQGHQFMVRQVVNHARQRGLDATVVTFPNHPMQVLKSDFHPQLLTLAEEKTALLKKTEIDNVALIPFTNELAQMDAYSFMRTILKEQLQVEVLLVGHDNHFGHDHKNFEDYRLYGKDLGIELIKCQELTTSTQTRFSSTEARQALLQGDLQTANSILGYPYHMQGRVVKGFQNGRKIGYPTANLQVHPHKLIPMNGAYLVSCQLSALNPNCQLSALNSQLSTPTPPTLFGMLNIGTRPTLHNGKQRSIEVHIFDFEGNLYGTSLQISLLHRLRQEQEFDTLNALRLQLARDEKDSRQWLTTHPTLVP